MPLATKLGAVPGLRGRVLSRLAVFLVWLALVIAMTAHHAFWRDEVRAFSLATQGSNVVDMLRGIQGEGHPALWYLLLRGAYDLAGSPVVLPIIAIAVAAAAALILLFLSPFPLWLIALILGTNFFAFEYTVMARNYGISLPLMFLFAHFYPTRRQRGLLLGLLLALLCNTNAHSVILAGAFILFWGLDLLLAQGLRWTPALRTYLVNAVIAAIGAALCAVTIYPPANDAVTVNQLITPRTLLTAVLMPAASLVHLALAYPADALGLKISGYPNSDGRKLMSLIMFASTLAVVRVPAALVAALASLIGFSVFFVVVYRGDYRHEALWLVFLISLYWIACARFRAAWPARDGSRLLRIAAGAGLLCLVLLTAMQVPVAVQSAIATLPGHPPNSRVQDLAALIRGRPDLQRAIVIADPDYVLEALPYYVDNPIYFLREDRFGRTTRFTSQAKLDLDLDQILQTARDLHAQRRVPVLIVLEADLDPNDTADRTIKEGYTLTLRTTPDQVRRFLAATDKLAFLRGSLMIDEEFDVYQLKPGD